ncbi:hypothetical protein CK203_108822 [Vitis vinifera]|uniref:Reverse transcriptase Ty1/copia-type domain-containing protein n=1 Tax=Vitis vinifera TaxID=29760 RepID=A0A438CE12_VITVI|nr:hypothetical protein CK203_108822 [Vitis vinifera]
MHQVGPVCCPLLFLGVRHIFPIIGIQFFSLGVLRDEEPNWLNVEWPEIEFDQDNSIQQRVGNEIIESEPNVEISLGVPEAPPLENIPEVSSPTTPTHTNALDTSAKNLDWPLHQFDVKNAFFHGDLEEKVYMDIPPRYTASSEGKMACDDAKEISRLQEQLSTEFEMKNLGGLKYFLGIEISRSRQGIFLCKDNMYWTCCPKWDC